jgi:hypothetical protein
MIRHEDTFADDNDIPFVDNAEVKMSMAHTKKSLTLPPQGVLKGLNYSSAVAILRDPPEANQMTIERNEGRF